MNLLCAKSFRAACLFAGTLQAECALAASDFPCAQVTPSTIMTPAYARDRASSVCEGFYEKAVSAPFIELVSLTLTSPKAMAGISNPTIVVSLPAAVRGSWRLLVQPLSVAMPYRVDAPVGPESVLKWSFARMAAATRTTLKDVGFVATPLNATDASTVVPVHILGSGEAAKGSPTTAAYVTVRVTGKTSQIVWRSYATDPGERSGELSWTPALNGPLFPAEFVTVEIPLAEGKHGQTIELKGTDAGSGEIHPLRILIPGSGP
jgi:hypothetical protein